MMPYLSYQLYQIERPKSALEIRYADERAGRTAAAFAAVLHPLTRVRPQRRPRQDCPVCRQLEESAAG